MSWWLFDLHDYQKACPRSLAVGAKHNHGVAENHAGRKPSEREVTVALAAGLQNIFLRLPLL